MRLQTLKYDFHTLPPAQQHTVFLEYYQKREKDLASAPPPVVKRAAPVEGKPKQKTVTLSTEQIELLKKLKLL